MRRPTVLGLPLQLMFPGATFESWGNLGSVVIGAWYKLRSSKGTEQNQIGLSWQAHSYIAPSKVLKQETDKLII